MAAFNKFQKFVDYLSKGAINFSSDTVKIMLTNTAPSATSAKYSDISGTELASGNGYTTGGATVTGVGASNTAGTETIAADPTTFTSSAGSMGPFRYVVYYDNTPTDKPLIGFYDYGASVTLNGAAGETFTVQQTGGLMTIS